MSCTLWLIVITLCKQRFSLSNISMLIYICYIKANVGKIPEFSNEGFFYFPHNCTGVHHPHANLLMSSNINGSFYWLQTSAFYNLQKH